MARRAEEEENHWPGFVDALSTIVMVVTFLLIILVVVIVVISQQVNPESSNQDADSSAEKVEVATLEQEIIELKEVVTEQVETLEQQEQLMAQTAVVVTRQTEVIEEKDQEILELQEQAIQTSVSDAGETPQVQSDAAIAEIDIVVPRVDTNVARENLRSEIETAQAVMTVTYEENAVELDENSREQALNFLNENGVIDSDQNVMVMSYFDGDSVSVSQAKRTAYYRLLAVRNALLDSGIDGRRIEISVTAATQNTDGSTNINRVKVFLR